MQRFHLVSLAALGLSLAACGGGDGGVASAPPLPPPPVRLTSTEVVKTPLSSSDYAGLVPGSYGAIAIAYDRAESPNGTDIGAQSTRLLGASDVRLIADPATRNYTVQIALADYPASQTFDLGHQDGGRILGIIETEFANHVVKTEHYSDGSTQKIEYDVVSGSAAQPIIDTSATTAEGYYLGYSLGLKYVSWGTWSHLYMSRPTPTSYGSGQLFKERTISFVAGRRTEPGELPITGTASYDLTFGGEAVIQKDQGVSIATASLDADFASAAISATLHADADPGDSFEAGPIRGLHATGTGTIASSGDFAIPLTGTTSLYEGGPDPNDYPIDGTMQGAFFGPAAEETGGVLQLFQQGTPLYAGTFVGGRR